MIRTLLSTLAVTVTAGMLVAGCGDNKADVTVMDQTWASADSAFLIDYNAMKTDYSTMQGEMQTMQTTSDPADTSMAGTRTAMQSTMTAHEKAMADIEKKMADARTKRDAAKAAGDSKAYSESWKTAEADYIAWRTEVERIRKEQADLRTRWSSMRANTNPGKKTGDTSAEGSVKVGGKQAIRVDANVKDTSKPLLRVEPGKEDKKPLIEKNKNP